MSLTVKIYGFQSIKNSIEIVVDGYCTIEGESNLGKSSVIRAIHAALSNRIGTEFITEDELVCEVIIESLGHTIKWHKDYKSTFYEVDGIKINKPGKGMVPDEVRAAGLYAIKTLDKELHWPQIHFQWEQPFIIGSYTDTLAAELLGASQDTLKISRAIKLVNADVSKLKTKMDFLEKQHQELSITVDKMEEITAKLNVLQRKVDQIETVRKDALKKESVYRDLIEKYRSFWSSWRISNAAVKASVPVILDGRERVMEIIRLYRESDRISRRIQVMGQVVSLQQVQRADLQDILSRIRLFKDLQGQFLKAQKELDSSVQSKGQVDVELKKISEERTKIEYLVNSIEKCPLCFAPMKNGCYCPDDGVLNGRRNKNDQVGVVGKSSTAIS